MDKRVVYGTERGLFSIGPIVRVWKSTVACGCDERTACQWYIPPYTNQVHKCGVACRCDPGSIYKST